MMQDKDCYLLRGKDGFSGENDSVGALDKKSQPSWDVEE